MRSNVFLENLLFASQPVTEMDNFRYIIFLSRVKYSVEEFLVKNCTSYYGKKYYNTTIN